jgi:hypothetical protein
MLIAKSTIWSIGNGIGGDAIGARGPMMDG